MSNGYATEQMRNDYERSRKAREEEYNLCSEQPLSAEQLNEYRKKWGLPPMPVHTRVPDNGQRNRRSDKVSDPVNKTGIDATLDERGSRYGLFTGHAAITQSLKAAMSAAPKWAALQPDQKEALEMVQHKIGRILNGDPDYHDSWHDIVGYAKLVADRLEGVQR